jgi:hypothetical protein
MDYVCLLFYCDWLGSDLRVGHFFSFRCPLVNTPQLALNHDCSLTDFSSTNDLWRRIVYEWINQSQSYFTTGGLTPISSSWRQAPWDSRPVIFFQRNTCGYSPYVTSSLIRGCVCRLQLLLALASAVILRSESRGTHDDILTSQIRDTPNLEGQVPIFISPRNRATSRCEPNINHHLQQFTLFCVHSMLCKRVLIP